MADERRPPRTNKPAPARTSPAQPAPTVGGSVAPARGVAAHILLMVERGNAHSDDLLRSPRANALTRQDRDLMTQLVLGTLRWERVLDQHIATLLARPDAEMHLGVIVALRLGAYQLLFLDRIPAHAAIGESVELAKQVDGQHAAGMVNAVLRRLSRERADHPLKRDAEAAHPVWMVARWQERFGQEATAKLCSYDQSPPPIALRIVDERAESSLADAGVVLAPGEFLAGARRVLSGDVNGTAALASGWVRIQDEASQLVAELAARPGTRALDQAPPQAVLDTCAAPGGKTAILLDRLPNAHITAMDISETRLRMMGRRLHAGDRLHLVASDAATLAPDPAYDAILCDVPCSGTGTLARNPEIRSRLQPAEFARQHDRQVAILSSALGALKPGAQLVYSTCSLEPEENERVIEEAIRNHDSYIIIPVDDHLASLAESGVLTGAGVAHLRETAVSGPYLRTIPGIHACDGFFAAIIRRV